MELETFLLEIEELLNPFNFLNGFSLSKGDDEEEEDTDSDSTDPSPSDSEQDTVQEQPIDTISD